MTSIIKTVEAVYEKGYLRPLVALEERPDVVYIVTVVDLAAAQQRALTAGSLRGKYRGYLSTSDDFARHKQAEKALER